MVNLIKQQFARTREGIMKALEDVSPETAKVIPDGFNNHIQWQVGHILTTGELYLFPGKGTLPAEYATFFDTGSKPREWTEGVPSLETLFAELKEQLVRIQDIPDEAFAEKLSNPLGLETFGEIAAMMAEHEATHLGQIQSLKRVVQARDV
ncbi:DinB family protein [Bacillus sp. B15-48]|uniref:DinB family protein n=1 Tax=Bacillus sp. B15-48 TaxID=1548601 RepID=UPI00193F7B28|nr:DinB family protein [Bacillus sp. B15-48]MBM4765128.1 DinB family protein [Bacillus sp. B15-48]